MTNFPTSSSDIVTTNLNSASDKPKDARIDLFNALTKLKEIIDSFDAVNGICGLNSSGKVDSSKLTGQVVNGSLGTDAVNGSKIADDSINSEHIVNGSVDYEHISFGSTDTTMGGASPSNTLIPTQGAVQGYISDQLQPSEMIELMRANGGVRLSRSQNWATIGGTETDIAWTSVDGFNILQTTDLPDDWESDWQEYSHEIAGGIFNNLVPINNDKKQIRIKNDGTYSFKVGKVQLTQGDNTTLNEGLRFRIRDANDNILFTHEEKPSYNYNNWGVNFNVDIAWTNATNGDWFKMTVQEIGEIDGGTHTIHCVVFQKTLRTALQNKIS